MIENIINTFRNCFKIPELKSRIFFTLIVLAIARVVSIWPAPGLDGASLHAYFDKQHDGGGLLGMYSMFTGGALERCAIGALGIMPYISATIILQLLTAVMPQLSKLAREEGGRTKIIQYGRYLTVVICLGQGFFTAIGWEKAETIFPGLGKSLVLYENLWWYRIQTAMLITTATLLLMWLGEQITDRGIGNGISLIISIGILARMPKAVQAFFDMFRDTETTGVQLVVFKTIALVFVLLGVIAGVIAVTQAQRKVPVQYAQRAIGRKVVQGQTSFLPLRLNFTGVMPIIFAQALLMLPQQLFRTIGQGYNIKVLTQIADLLRDDKTVYLFLYGTLILLFSYFWVAIRRLHPRGPPRPGHCGLSAQCHEPYHAGRRHLHDHHCDHPDVAEPGDEGGLQHRHVLWRHERPDPRRSHARHHAPDGVAPVDAPLRRLSQERPAQGSVLAGR